MIFITIIIIIYYYRTKQCKYEDKYCNMQMKQKVLVHTVVIN